MLAADFVSLLWNLAFRRDGNEKAANERVFVRGTSGSKPGLILCLKLCVSEQPNRLAGLPQPA